MYLPEVYYDIIFMFKLNKKVETIGAKMDHLQICKSALDKKKSFSPQVFFFGWEGKKIYSV